MAAAIKKKVRTPPAPQPRLSHNDLLDRIKAAVEEGRSIDEVDGAGFSIASGLAMLDARLRQTVENDVTTMLCVSTAHLPNADALAGVEFGHFEGDWGDVISLRTSDERPLAEIFPGLDERVLSLLEHARAQGHGYVMFDGDGFIVDGFDTFDW